MIFITLDKKPSKIWPHEGQIIFKTFYLRYDQDAPFILNNLNFNIAPAEKVIIYIITFSNLTSEYKDIYCLEIL